MTVGIVDRFEPIQINQHGHKGPISVLKLIDCMFEAAPVEERGKMVLPGIALHFRGKPLGLMSQAARVTEARLSNERGSSQAALEKQDGKSQNVVFQGSLRQQACGGNEEWRCDEVYRCRSI